MTFKIFRYISLAIIGIIILSLSLTQIKSVKLGVFSFLSGVVEERTGYKITVDDIDLMLPFVIKTEGLRIQKNQDSLVSIERSIFRFNPKSLVERKLIFHSITLNDVNINDRLIKQEEDTKSQELNLDFSNLPLFITIPQFHAYNLKLESDTSVSITEKEFNVEGHIKLDPSNQSIATGFKLFDVNDREKFIALDVKATQISDGIDLDVKWVQDKDLLFPLTKNLFLDTEVNLSGKASSWESLLKGEIGSAHDGITGSVESKFVVTDPSLEKTFTGKSFGQIDLSASKGLKITHLMGEIDALTLSGNLYIDRESKLNGTELTIGIENFETYRPYHGLDINGKTDATLSINGPLSSPAIKVSAQSPVFVFNDISFTDLHLIASGVSIDEGLEGELLLSFAEENDRLESRMSFRWDYEEKLEINNFKVTHPKADVYGRFSYLFTDGIFEGNFKGDVEDLSIFKDFNAKELAGSVSFEATFTDSDGQNIDMFLKSTGVKYGEYSFNLFEGVINVKDIYRHPQGAFDLKAGSIQKNGYTIDSVTLASQLTVGSDEWPLFITVKNKDLDLTSEGTWYTDKESLFLNIDILEGKKDTYYYSLTNPVNITIKEDYTDVSPFVLRVAEGTIHTSLTYKNSKLSSELQIVDIPIPFLSREIYSQPIEGMVTTTAHLHGTPDQLFGDLQVELSNVTLQEENDTHMRPLNGSLQIKLDEEGTVLHGMVFSPNSTPVLLDAKIPITAKLKAPVIDIDRNGPLAIALKASGTLTPLLEFLAAEDLVISGDGNVRVDISGSLAEPQITGNADITEGTLESFIFGTRLYNIKASFVGNGQNVTMTSLSASDEKGGTVNGEGTIKLDPLEGFPTDIQLNLEGLRLIRLDNVSGIFDGTIHMKGDKDKILMKGELTSQKTDYTIAKRIDEITETVDVVYINQPSNELPPTIIPKGKLADVPMELDINIHIPENLKVKDDDLNSTWSGDVNVSGTTDKIITKGELNLVKGDYLLNGQQFELNPGTITFNGNPEKKTSIYIVASRDINDYRVDIVLQGKLLNPNIVLRSSPPMPQQEVLSLILFGRSPTEISSFQDQQLEQSLSNLTKDQSGPGFVDKIQKTIGIDRIDINRQEYDDREEVSIQVGKYITRDVYISLNKGFGDEPTRVALEAKLKHNFKVQLDAGESSRGSDDKAAGQISLLWKHDY
ncbi:MAG: translocation/assembly module TamB domain-containing protein [Chlamydiota bacterium]|nr:translocation/assembly module TamB domain-containing protein [Chlamydiota bacterium]